jgi:hypothetical protein
MGGIAAWAGLAEDAEAPPQATMSNKAQQTDNKYEKTRFVMKENSLSGQFGFAQCSIFDFWWRWEAMEAHSLQRRVRFQCNGLRLGPNGVSTVCWGASFTPSFHMKLR